MNTLNKVQVLILGLAVVIAIACSIYVAFSPGFALTPVLLTTVVAVALTGTLAYILVFHSSEDRFREIGVALASGVVFLLAAAMTQAASDVNNFRNSIAFERDLHGFDPAGRSLRGLNFGGKDLSVANLNRTNLHGARLRQADLSTADLSHSDLSNADLFYAQLHEADVHRANFSKADLRGAKLGTRLPENLDLAIFAQAKVSEDTCWRIPRKRDKNALSDVTPTMRGRETIDFLRGAGLVPLDPGRALGHVCTANEGEVAGQHPPQTVIYLCPSPPYLRDANMMESNPQKPGSYC